MPKWLESATVSTCIGSANHPVCAVAQQAQAIAILGIALFDESSISRCLTAFTHSVC
jgi:hypothetical protein